MRGAARRLLRGPLRAACCALCFALPSAVAAEPDYPARAVRLIAPYTAGGIVDIIARIVAAALADQLRQSVVVENRAGAAGTVGMKAVATSAPDGYTLGLATTGPMTIVPALRPAPGYAPLADFTPIALLATAPQWLLVSPDLPVRSVAELVAYARANPGKVTYASAGVGTTGHLAGALFESLAQVQLLHVPYTGNQAALRDVLAGRVQVLYSPLPPMLQDIRAGRLRALAVAGTARSPLLPDVPTIAEAGYPGAEAPVWYGLVAPANTPQPIVERLVRALQTAAKQDRLARRIVEAGADPELASPQEFERLLVEETAKWRRIVEARGIRVE